MTVNSALARIYGSDSDAIHLAPYGTTLPTTIDGELDDAFEDVGWLNDEGLAETLSGSKTKMRGHQGNAVVRTRMNETGTEIGFTALETKAQTNALRYHEKSVDTTTAGVRKTTRGPGQLVSVRAAVIDLFDADDDDVKLRLVIPRFEIVANGDRTMTATDIAGYPFIGEIIGDYMTFETDLED